MCRFGHGGQYAWCRCFEDGEAKQRHDPAQRYRKRYPAAERMPNQMHPASSLDKDLFQRSATGVIERSALVRRWAVSP